MLDLKVSCCTPQATFEMFPSEWKTLNELVSGHASNAPRDGKLYVAIGLGHRVPNIRSNIVLGVSVDCIGMRLTFESRLRGAHYPP